jgi:hypothetical protein
VRLSPEVPADSFVRNFPDLLGGCDRIRVPARLLLTTKPSGRRLPSFEPAAVLITVHTALAEVGRLAAGVAFD